MSGLVETGLVVFSCVVKETGLVVNALEADILKLQELAESTGVQNY